MKKALSLICTLLLAGWLPGCSQGEPPDAVVLDGGHAEAPSDMSTEAPDSNGPGDADAGMQPKDMGPDFPPLPTDFDRFVIDESKWPLIEPCEGTVDMEPWDGGAFALPEPSEPSPLQASDLEGEGVRSRILKLNRAYRSQPADKYVDRGYVTNDEDLSVFYHFAIGEQFGAVARLFPYDEALVTLTVLVDHEPVPDARIIRWSTMGTRKLEEVQGSGMMFRPTKPVESFEFVIPREAFDAEGSHEVSVYIHPFPPGFRSGVTRVSEGIEIHNGSYQRPPRPCSQPIIDEPYEPIEADSVTSPSGASGGYALILFPESVPSIDELFFSGRPIPAQPGETVRMYASYIGSRFLRAPALQPIMPVLDGVPLLERALVIEIGDVAEEHVQNHAFWRGSFDVTMPQEKGLHAVHIASWEYLYHRIFDAEGIGLGTVPSPLKVGSNVVVFDVQ